MPDFVADAAAPRPWERPGAVRRDCDPPRGRLLLVLGSVSVVLGYIALAGGVTGLAGLPLGLAAWVLARGDLARMSDGLVDPDGRGPTEQARRLGLVGVILSLFFLVCYGILWGLVLGVRPGEVFR
jgi:hypothetical protein